jgi:hypothetical protein
MATFSLSVLGGERQSAMLAHWTHSPRRRRQDPLSASRRNAGHAGGFHRSAGAHPELVRRFEGGADIVVGERTSVPNAPVAVRRLRRIAPWLLRPFGSVPGVADPFASFRQLRLASRSSKELASARRGLALFLAMFRVGDAHVGHDQEVVRQFARRVETVSLEQRFDIRPRPSRIRPFADALNLYRFAWATRGRRIAPPSTAAT